MISSPFIALDKATHIRPVSVRKPRPYLVPLGVTKSKRMKGYSYPYEASIVTSVKPAVEGSVLKTLSYALYSHRTAI